MKTDNYFTDFNIAGFTYYDGVDVFDKLKVGAEVLLKPEPDNKYDKYAVAIYFNGKKLGFIPRGTNKSISKLLNLGHNIFTAKINRINPADHPEHQIGVVVKIKKVINTSENQ